MIGVEKALLNPAHDVPANVMFAEPGQGKSQTVIAGILALKGLPPEKLPNLIVGDAAGEIHVNIYDDQGVFLISGTTTLQVVEGRMVEVVGTNHDHLGILQQVGALPGPPG